MKCQVEGRWSQPVTPYRRSLDKRTHEGRVNITHFLRSKLSSNGLTLSQLCFYKNYGWNFRTAPSYIMHSVLEQRKQWQKQYISVGKTDLFYNSMGLCGNFAKLRTTIQSRKLRCRNKLDDSKLSINKSSLVRSLHLPGWIHTMFEIHPSSFQSVQHRSHPFLPLSRH